MPIAQEAGWYPVSVYRSGRKISPPTGIRAPSVSARNAMPALLKSEHNKNSDLIKTRDVYVKLLVRGEHREVQEQRKYKRLQFEYFVNVFVAEKFCS